MKGKKGQVVWSCLAEKCKELGLFCNRTGPIVKEFFNLSKKYKQANDKTHVSREGNEAVDDCLHFHVFDEFMGSCDVISPKYISKWLRIVKEKALLAKLGFRTLSK